MSLRRHASRMPRQSERLLRVSQRRVPALGREALGPAQFGLGGGLVQEGAQTIDIPDKEKVVDVFGA